MMSSVPSLSSEKPLLTFGVLTDVQYADCDDKPAWYDPSLIRYYRNALNQVERAYAHWSRMPGVSLVLQLGDLIDQNNGGCGRGLDRVLSALGGTLPTYHTVGNHELYNCTRRDLVRRYVCPRLLPDWTPPSTDDPVFYYSFSPVPGVKLISLDCFEEGVLGRDPSEPRWQQAAELLSRVHGTWDRGAWEWPDALPGLEKRFIDSNGALSETQLKWLGTELAESDAAGEVVIVFGHLAISPASANSDCLLWNYQDVMDLFEAHPCVALYLCGHTHRCGYATDARGTHYMALAGIIETEPESVAFSTVSVFPDRIEVVGSGREESRTLRIRSMEKAEEEELSAASSAVVPPLTVRVAV
ncbi:manganese-dependent ADP-ribose/CDP-alcohol diphosphatase-like isoform X1 [Amblyomma americanum]